MLKAIKIRVYPNNQQEVYLYKFLGCYRLVFNKCLDKKKNEYETNKTNLGLKELSNYFHQGLTKSEEYEFLNEHNTKVLKQSIINLLESYKNFFKNKKGFPKFKSKHNNKQSCRFPEESISSNNDYNSGRINLNKQLKNLKFRSSDEYKKYLNKYKNRIKNATLSKTSTGNYFLSILIDGNIEKQLKQPVNNIIGIDLGIKDFVITSKGMKFENIKSIRNNEKQLIKLQKQLNKKKRIKTGEFIFSKKWNKDIEITRLSNNGEKARKKLAKIYKKITNIKENYLHEVVNQLLNENQVIVMENLNVKGMLKNHNLAKSIQELSLNRFKNILLYKSDWYDRTVIEIDRWFPSSKLCSECGYKNNELKLLDREWICPKCYTHHDRDYNAAKNIENEGLRILNSDLEIDKNRILVGSRTTELTLVDYSLMDDKEVISLRSYDRMIQEEENV
jgi:putative transposase